MRKFTLIVFALMAISCGRLDSFITGARLGEEWNGPNDPINMGEGYVTEFARLPLSASLEKTPWSDSYWPSVEGGISARWQGGGPMFQPKLWLLRRMPQERLARMSPAEKYDVFIGNYNYDIKSQERRRTRGSNAGWEGICHGWAAASMLYEEPDAVTLQGENGIEVPFGASDVKALLSFYLAQVAEAPTRMLGERCNENLRRKPAAGQSPACRDTNAGAFHVVLTNMLGLQKKGFIIDRDRSDQVWNQPVWHYEIQVEGKGEPSPGAAPGTVEEVTVSSNVSYVMEVHPHWDALGDNSPSFTAEYRYRLELDGSGKIIGGEWLTDVRPDFMWMQEKPEFTGYFAPLKKIYEASVRAH
jgi:hypothetical protein